MNLIDIGETTHFVVRYDPAVGANAAIRAQAVLSTCEADLAKAAWYLPYSMGGGGDPYLESRRIVVQVVDLKDNRGGANNSHTGDVTKYHTISIGAINGSGGQISDDYARFLFVAELAEVLIQAYGWNPSTSSGEALSRVMAEQLYPVQGYAEGGAPWVNAWFSDPNRIYTYLVLDEYSDRNAVTYGIGILYINYLRSQLGHSLRDICLSGGQTFLDRYRNLSGHPDEDGIAPFKALLEAHFAPGSSLATNNPFPLYDDSRRGVSMSARTTGRHDLSAVTTRDRVTSAVLGRWGAHERKTVHIQPFIGCPAMDYAYTLEETPRHLEVVATAAGFGQPNFTWRVNGRPRVWANDSISVPAEVTIDDPEHPDNPHHATDTFAFAYSTQNEFTFAALSNRLTIDNFSYGGHYLLKIEVSVSDQLGPAGSATSSLATILDTAAVVYEQQYYTDRERCAERIRSTVDDHTRGLAKAVDLVKTLPEPPDPAVVRTLLDALADVRAQLVSPETDTQAAYDGANLAALHLGVPVLTLTHALGVRLEQQGIATDSP